MAKSKKKSGSERARLLPPPGPSHANDTAIPVESENAFTKIEQYYSIQANNEDIKFNVGKYILINAVSAGSIWLYASTGGKAAGDDVVLRWKFITAGTSLNFCTTFNTTKEFIEWIQSNRIPTELKPYLKPQTNKLELTVIGASAFISALPMTAAVVSRAETMTLIVFTELGVTQLTNTFIHTFPLLLIARVPALRFLFKAALLTPVLPIIACYKVYQWCTEIPLSSEEQASQELFMSRQKNAAYLKSKMLDTLKAGQEMIMQQNFSYTSSWNINKPWNSFSNIASNLNNLSPYKIEVPAAFKDPKNITLLSIAEQAQSFFPISIGWEQFKNVARDTVIGGVGWLFWSAGVSPTNLGSAGYYWNAYNKAYDLLDSTVGAWTASLPANVLIAVLISYFAGRFMRETLWGSAVAWFKGEYHTPEGFKRYPKTIIALTIIATYLACYGYATGEELIEENFADPKYDTMRPVLLACVRYGGIAVFLLKNTIEFLLTQATNLVARYFGGDDNKASAELNAVLSSMINAVSMMKDEVFIASLKKLQLQQQQKLLRLDSREIQRLLVPFEIDTTIKPEEILPEEDEVVAVESTAK